MLREKSSPSPVRSTLDRRSSRRSPPRPAPGRLPPRRLSAPVGSHGAASLPPPLPPSGGLFAASRGVFRLLGLNLAPAAAAAPPPPAATPAVDEWALRHLPKERSKEENKCAARANRRGVLIRAQVSTTDSAVAAEPTKAKKVSKKQDEGVVTNKYQPKEPYVGKCLLNTKITADDTPGETWHMVFSTDGEIPYREGQSIGVIADGLDKNGKPHTLRLYSIASSALGDFDDSVSVKRLVYTNDQGEIVNGVCSNFLFEFEFSSSRDGHWILQL